MKRLLLPMTLIFALPVYAGDSAVPTLDPVDSRVLAEFRAFADKEIDREKDGFRRYVDTYIIEPKGVHFMGKKHMFRGYKVEAVPNVWTFDVRKTNSIVSPYQGVIEFPVIFLFSSMWVKGYKEDCSGQTLKYCLDHEGELFESEYMYKSEQVRIPRKVEREYVYQDNTWVPKLDFDALMVGLVALLESERPLQPQPQPRTIFGLPAPPVPAVPPKEGSTS